MPETLSLPQARKLVLLSQRVPPSSRAGTATAATLSTIEHLGYIQIDTISVVQRAHHHTLWNRNPRYVPSQLDQLLDDKQLFEYWSHAAAYLPMRDYRFSLPRKHALASGAQQHWYARDEPLMQRVRQRITAEGPLTARDFEHTGTREGFWSSKPAKRALEYLFMQGELMVPRRANFQKVYDLTERVLPSDVNTTPPGPVEYARHLIARFLRANGLGRPSEMAYLLKDTRRLVSETAEAMVADGELQRVQVDGTSYLTLPNALELLSRPLPRRKLKILSPFDNLVIQRKRLQALFGFDYLIECYVPEPKRRYGYFSLPVLWDGRLVARMDCTADRSAGRLHIHHLALEPALEPALEATDAFLEALHSELERFLPFNQCQTLRLHRTSPNARHAEVARQLRHLSG